MKKNLLILTGVVILAVALTTVALAANPIKLIVNGQEIKPDVPPQLINGRTMVPIRFVAEALNADVKWDKERHAVVITSKSEVETSTSSSANDSSEWITLREIAEEHGLTISGRMLKFEDEIMVVGGVEFPIKIVNGRTMVRTQDVDKIVKLIRSTTTTEENKIKTYEGKIGETIAVEGLRIRVDEIKYVSKSRTILPPEGMKFANVTITITNDSREADSWAKISNWMARSEDTDHPRYEEWVSRFSRHTSSTHPKVSDWIRPGETLTTDIDFKVYEGMKLSEVHYVGIPNVKVIFKLR